MTPFPRNRIRHSPMKIVLLTESLGSGGAERQVCTLAVEFKRRGHEVCVATYAPGDFYKPLLERECVEHRFLGGHGKVSWAVNVRRFLRTHGQDVVLAFLAGPSAYAELAGWPTRSWGLVVSERSAGSINGIKAELHAFADYVVTNSHSARIAVASAHAGLGPKLVTIYNAINVEPHAVVSPATRGPHEVRLVVAARLDRNKNAQGLLAALQVVGNYGPSLRLGVDWYGNQEAEPETARVTADTISRLNLGGVIRLHPPTENVHDIMLQADAVLLPSFCEGLPNSVCEGMALGKPILMSEVCEARNLVEEGVNGFLFDPHSPASIADAIARFARLTSDEKDRMGRASRAKAEVLFDVGTVADRYLRVLEAAAARKDVRIENWPEEVPDTALRGSSGSNGRGSGRG
jgi:glycosyltransferase involved in cell wall biosynthesis